MTDFRLLYVGSGIGRACSLAFAKEGAANIMVADLDIAAARRVADETKAAAANPHCKVEASHIDVTSEQSVRDAIKTVSQLFGRIDYCVNCAGVCTYNAGLASSALQSAFLFNGVQSR